MNVDMSPDAVTLRLKRVSQLRRLGLSLGKALPAGHSAKPTIDESSVRDRQPLQVKQ
jgi:hypothetical protein